MNFYVSYGESLGTSRTRCSRVRFLTWNQQGQTFRERGLRLLPLATVFFRCTATFLLSGRVKLVLIDKPAMVTTAASLGAPTVFRDVGLPDVSPF
jgi:hypothetical protein